MTAAMRKGHEAYVAKQRQAAIDRVLRAKAYNASSAAIVRAERDHGAGSDEHIRAKLVHASRYHGVTFPIPSDNDYAIYREAVAA